MATATIKVLYVNDPKEGQTKGSVKTDSGEYYGVPQAMLAEFSKGGVYTVEYTTRKWKDKTYKDVASIIGADAPAAAAPSRGKYGAHDDVTAERIFVQGLLQAYIKAGRLEADGASVTKATNVLRAVWRDTLGKKPTKNEEEMNDGIPF